MASSSPDDVRHDFCFINRLPQETLSEIFTITYLSIPHSSRTRNPLSLKALPRVFSRVDRRWRAIARSTKLIWLDFEITSKNKPTWVSKTAISSSVKRARAVLTQWLKLACAHERDPRGLQFRFETGLKVSPVDTEILAVLAEYSNHWQRACFDIPIRATTVLSPIQGHLSRLESIELDLQRDMMDEMGEIEHGTRAFPPSFAAALKHAPKLTRLSCYGFWEDNATIQIDLPFHQLRNVCVVDKYALDCYHLLRKSARSLEFATITPISIDPTAIWPAQLASGLPVIRLPSLQRLMYLNDHTETVGIKGGTIFRSLEVPNLRTLILFDQDGRASYHEAFEMLLRSRCRSLKRLDLRGAYANAASDTANLLDITNNSLESLYVDGVLNSLFSQYRMPVALHIHIHCTSKSVSHHLAEQPGTMG
ncbi:hypothetical protein V5O48_003728 [Marasmius crinis-equi]|uniref:F-box domain-containing protein n=1 Tax=Marasmius crinis-equi TaxID=585013 RepID=A0ABR3FS26_9AGAR